MVSTTLASTWSDPDDGEIRPFHRSGGAATATTAGAVHRHTLTWTGVELVSG